jgi:hypothetical protein
MDPLHLFAVIFIGAIVLTVLWLNHLPPANASILIEIQHGKINVAKGSVLPHAREHVISLLSEAKIARGYVAVTTDRRVVFSQTIPGPLHQKLRNVLLNQ